MVRADLPSLGERRIEEVTTADVEAWFGQLGGKPSSRAKALIVLNGIFKRARRVLRNPVEAVA